VTLIAGTPLIMWFGELITQRGIGNGMSLLIFASIVARFPIADRQSVRLGTGLFTVVIIALVVLFVIAAIVTMERAQRRIPVQYAKRVVGRKGLRRRGNLHPAQDQRRQRGPDHLRLGDPVLPDADRSTR
jgi:preprotein translocase subunit SecY